MTASTQAHRPPGDLRVLIVDHCEDTAASLSFMLAGHDTEVRIAKDRQSAVLEAGRFGPDVCIFDSAVLAGGETALSQAICDRCLRRPLLIALSGFAPPGSADHAAAQVDHHFDEPPRPEQLTRLLDGVRSRRG